MAEHQDNETARERLFAREIDEVVGRVEAIEMRLREVEIKARDNASAVRIHGRRIDRLRIDKQILGLPSWIREKRRGRTSDGEPVTVSFRPNPKRLLLVAPQYPSGGATYGGQPVERRVRFYLEKGFEVAVFVPDNLDVTERSTRQGVQVVRGPSSEIGGLLADWSPGQICWHHPLPEMWPWIRSYVGVVPIHVWIHGFEARRWKELEYNYTSQEIANNRSHWDALEVDRRRLLVELFVDSRITKIFVSEFMRGVAERFAGVTAANSHVIHNVIDTKQFSYTPKSAEDRNRIVSVRSFTARNYATDLLAGTVEELSQRPFFEELRFKIYGDGKHFEEDTAFLHKFDNVEVIRRFVEPDEMKKIFHENGVLLIPSRWDSQGMTMGEGMSAGMVPVTNAVAAIPEFVDGDSGYLAPPEDVKGLAEGIAQLHLDPERFETMSRTAAKRAREQTGPEATVAREVEILRGARVGLG